MISVLFCALSLTITSCGRPKYIGPEESVNMEWSLDRYAQNIASKTGMQFLKVGDVTDSQKTEYCLFFRSFDSINLEKAQMLSASLVEDFWNMLKKDPSVLAYIDWRQIDEREFKRNMIWQ